MSHQDQHAQGVRRNSVDLLEALQWLFRGVRFSEVSLRDDCTWTPRWLAAAALLWVWSGEATLTERFACSRRLVAHLRGDDVQPAGSYQAFLKLLCRWTEPLVTLLQQALRQRMQEMTSHWKLHGLVVFGMDGSRIDLPRTKSHERVAAPSRTPARRTKTGRGKRRAPSRQKHASHPQLWLTTLFHVSLPLPWNWRIGPADSSERSHVLDMLESLPEESAGGVAAPGRCRVRRLRLRPNGVDQWSWSAGSGRSKRHPVEATGLCSGIHEHGLRLAGQGGDPS